MSPADNTPDFDSMSPEEVMAWMESLAKRQGASEGFTTSADMEIPEIDPTTVVIDEPGYVPYGEEERLKKQAAEAAEAPKPEPVPPPTPAVAPPPSPIPAMQPAAQAQPEPVGEQDAMAWLESLAADQGTGFAMDLSSLSAEIEEGPLAPAPVGDAADTMAWLENLAQSQGEISDVPAEPAISGQSAEQMEAEIADPLGAGVDPMAWLESLAKRQGARAEELTTAADMEVPVPTDAVIDEPGYTEFRIESPTTRPQEAIELPPAAAAPEPVGAIDASQLDDPAKWLESLAAGEGFEPEAATPAGVGEHSDEAIMEALSKGEVSREQMQVWLERQADKIVENPDLLIGDEDLELEEEFNPDAPAVPAEIPDWLLEQVGQPPSEEAVSPPAAEKPPLVEEIVVPPTVEMPDWLREGVSEPEEINLENIFASTEETAAVTVPSTSAPVGEVLVDASDPWVEAFDQEHEQGAVDISKVPAWYTRNLEDPERQAAVERAARGEGLAGELEEASFQPEAELSAGEPEELPDWLQATAPTAETAPVPAELPDWLKEAEVEPADIPDWLTETLDTEQPEEAIAAVISVVPTPPAPTPPPTPPTTVRPVAASPAPVPAHLASIDADATLANARSKASSGDLAGSLQDYEALIRANVQLETAVNELSRLGSATKDNPAILRVLGDGLMRQGRLQQALDTYRKALNLL